MNVLTTRGFPVKFVQWVFHLLSTSSSTILINGQQSPPFMHKRGLRQGDPLSPYLFLLAADVLQRMTASISSLVPHRLAKKLTQPVLTFQYADDTVFLLSAKGQTIRLLLLVLHCFSLGSGLHVNMAKSAMVPFSIATNHVQRIQALIGCQVHDLPIAYLGMPLSLRAPKREDFVPLLQKIENRLEGWRARFISRAGKLQLVNSVLSAIPTYYMSCFRLPKWLIERIDAIRRNFLWSKIHPAAGIHLLNWKTVTLPKNCGGWGVPDLHLKNITLLLRWWWTIFASDHKLWKTYATLIYALPLSQPTPIILSKKGSFFWNSISSLRTLFHSCSQFQVVSGDYISFWHDGWDGLPLILDSTGSNNSRSLSLAGARNSAITLFDQPLTLRQHLAIQRLNNYSPTSGPDILLWTISPSRSFTTKSVYRILSEGGKVQSEVSSSWKIRATPSMKCFFHLLLHNKILTHDNMLRRHMAHTPGCVMCPGHQPRPQESALHLFFQCPFAMRIWLSLSQKTGYPLPQANGSVMQTYLTSLPVDRTGRKKWNTLFVTTTWLLWKERNERIFRHTAAPLGVLTERILHEMDLCLKYC